MARWLLLSLLAILLLGLGFGGGFAWSQWVLPSPTATASSTPSPTHTPTLTPSNTATPTPSATATAEPSLTPSQTASPAGTSTFTPTPSRTPSITPTPTYDPPDARVQVQSNCRYGPGAAYLYEWGLYPTDRVEIYGRNADGSWVYVDPWTYMDRCWVKADLLDVFRGDVYDAPVYYGRLPFSDLYRPPTNPRASRSGDQVIIDWDTVWMTEDDDRGYLLEIWVCRAGQLLFTPIHVDVPPAYVFDEAGCSIASNGRLYTAEKHGYTQWVRIPWPEHPAQTPGPTPAG
jgi:hypothetical protein